MDRTAFLLALILLLAASSVLRIFMLLQIAWPEKSGWTVLWGIVADFPLTSVFAYLAARLSKATGWSKFVCLPLCTVFLFVLGFWKALQYYYFAEFHTRPDQIFVDYVVYTAEVTGTVWEGYPVVAVIAVLFILAVSVTIFLRRTGASQKGRRVASWNLTGKAGVRKAVLGLVVYSSLVGFFTLQRVPFQSKTLSEVADNGIIRLLRAIRLGTLDFHSYYAHLPDPAALREAREYLSGDPQFVRFDGDGLKHLRTPAAGKHPSGPLNVVLILSESLGTELVEGLSPQGCHFPTGTDNSPTPRLHEYLQTGIVFPRTYATGTRTARGMEAVFCSLPPVPGPAIFKRRSIRALDSIASVLGSRGYETVFIYGGGLSFDHMDKFLPEIGFQQLIGESRIEEQLQQEAFRNSWGYADEFVFDQTLKEMVLLREEKKPFLISVLTLTNHQPRTFPEGRVKAAIGSNEGALAYADYALGRFLDQAKEDGFFTDTLFVIIADHGPRAYLSEQLPLDAHRVVFALMGAGITEHAGRCDLRRISNMDVTPTVLGVLGKSYESVFFGHDVLAGAPQTYAFVQDKRDVGFVTDDQLAIIGFRGEDAVAVLDGSDQPLDIKAAGTEHPLVRRGTALLQAAYGMQKGKW